MDQMLKTQLMTWSMIKSEDQSLMGMMYGFMALNVIEMVLNAVPRVSKYIMDEYVSKKQPNFMKTLQQQQEQKNKSASVTFQYYQTHENSTINSIIEYMCKQNTTKFLRFMSRTYKPSNFKPFLVNYKDVECKIQNEKYSQDGVLESFTFELYSYQLELTQLKQWLNKIEQEYELEKKNQLGDAKYYFKEIVMPPMKMIDPDSKKVVYNWDLAPKKYTFSMCKFHTNKDFNNIFGEEVSRIQERVDLFMNHPEWYKKRGIPQTLGILLHGDPGTGKTSTIKAIANHAHKHIISVSLAEYTTQEQLNHLFLSESIDVLHEGQTITYKIPLNQRLYVFEDIDCLSDIVQDRNSKPKPKSIQETSTTSTPTIDPFNAFSNQASVNQNYHIHQSETSQKQITLSFLLNLFDGILETPERLLILTTNYPEKLDPALIRPGRIDLNIHFKRASIETLQEMFHYFYEESNGYDFPESLNEKYTPARIIQILSQHYENPKKAYEILIDAE